MGARKTHRNDVEGERVMKRDMDLIRLILLEIEKAEENEVENMNIDGYSKEDIVFNAKLLKQNNMIENFEEDVLENYYIGSLTWGESDYLDSIRDNSKWKRIKSVIKEKALPFTFDIVKSVATTIIVATAEGITNSILHNP